MDGTMLCKGMRRGQRHGNDRMPRRVRPQNRSIAASLPEQDSLIRGARPVQVAFDA